MNKTTYRKIILAIFCTGITVTASAQTFKTLASFDGTNGLMPFGSLLQGVNGNLYGTTSLGALGINCDFQAFQSGCGTVFEVTPAGKLTTLYSFCSQTNCTDGAYPYGSLVQGVNGNFYGTTFYGAAGTYCFIQGCGTAFEITPAGKLIRFYDFCSQINCTDGSNPSGGLVQATNGSFYGTTYDSGANGAGTVFKITPAGKLTTLYNFCPNGLSCTEGGYPQAGLVQGTNGNFFGTTTQGGANGFSYGTVFEMTPAGILTTLYNFCSQPNCTDGDFSKGGLVQATDGNFYGNTLTGGANGAGTVFKITPAGKLTTLYSFCSQANCADGGTPYNGLVQATNGNFYGTTSQGGANGEGGTVFEITPAGKLTTLYSFCSQTNCTDGSLPFVGLIQDTNGNLYGTTASGGDITCNFGAPYGCGTVFSISIGLGPFVKTLPGAGKVGGEVEILGNKLTGATGVTFNGKPAQFTVKSATQILSHVPSGATTGYVGVTTPTGVLTSNVPFNVIP
jgi:uncharacterized repeat protein (TIGR03803 family)